MHGLRCPQCGPALRTTSTSVPDVRRRLVVVLPSENSNSSSEYLARAPHRNFQCSDVRLADNDPFTLVDDVRDWARADPLPRRRTPRDSMGRFRA